MIKYNPYNWEIKPRKDNLNIKVETDIPIILDVELDEEKFFEEVRQACLDNIKVVNIK